MIFYFPEKFVRPRMIYTPLKDLYYVEWFGVRWMICTALNHLGSIVRPNSTVSSFSQHDKPITRERNVIDFGGYFIYGGHFMDRQWQASDMQTRKCKNITSKQPLNWIRLTQVGNIQGCFVDFKLYFSLSKLIQSLFKSVFISYCHSNKNF